MSTGSPPRWASLQSLRDEVARTVALSEAILEQLERDGEGFSFTGEERRAHAWLAHRERELFVP